MLATGTSRRGTHPFCLPGKADLTTVECGGCAQYDAMRCGSFAAAAAAVALSYWTRMQVLDCGDSDFYGIAFSTLGEAWRGVARHVLDFGWFEG